MVFPALVVVCVLLSWVAEASGQDCRVIGFTSMTEIMTDGLRVTDDAHVDDDRSAMPTPTLTFVSADVYAAKRAFGVIADFLSLPTCDRAREPATNFEVAVAAAPDVAVATYWMQSTSSYSSVSFSPRHGQWATMNGAVLEALLETSEAFVLILERTTSDVLRLAHEIAQRLPDAHRKNRAVLLVHAIMETLSDGELEQRIESDLVALFGAELVVGKGYYRSQWFSHFVVDVARSAHGTSRDEASLNALRNVVSSLTGTVRRSVVVPRIAHHLLAAVADFGAASSNTTCIQEPEVKDPVSATDTYRLSLCNEPLTPVPYHGSARVTSVFAAPKMNAPVAVSRSRSSTGAPVLTWTVLLRRGSVISCRVTGRSLFLRAQAGAADDLLSLRGTPLPSCAGHHSFTHETVFASDFQPREKSARELLRQCTALNVAAETRSVVLSLEGHFSADQ